MLYATVEDEKVEATPHTRGKCLCCNKEVISKCGELNIWHWSHTVDDNCDDWYEPETEWHRKWKWYFGKNNSEVIFERDNKKHIADIFTDHNVVIELQNSAISTETIRAREKFYGEKMIWVINATSDEIKFTFHDKDPTYDTSLPPNLFYSEEILQRAGWFIDFEDVVVDEKLDELLTVTFGFMYKPDINKYFKVSTHDKKFGKYFIRRIKKFNQENLLFQKPENTFYYTWSHPWKSWVAANRPAFIHFDSDFLFYVKEGLGTRYGNGTIITKPKFIAKYRDGKIITDKRRLPADRFMPIYDTP